MLKHWLFVVPLLSIVCASQVKAADDNIDSCCTTYVNQQTGASLHKIAISKDPKTGQPILHVWASAFPDDIDWGESKAEMFLDSTHNTGPMFVTNLTAAGHKYTLMVRSSSAGGRYLRSTLLQRTTGDRPQQFTDENFSELKAK